MVFGLDINMDKDYDDSLLRVDNIYHIWYSED